MHRRNERKRILFVDDEPSIRATLPPVIEQSGFEVRTAASVPDALFEINSYEFDALIADLNISEEGDGFLVVSAMRHLQPNCINLILTGYPALETALQAIRNQVDDYFIKPADVELIVSSIRDRLENRSRKPALALKSLPAILKENSAQLRSLVLTAIKQQAELSCLGLPDDERIQHLWKLISALVEHFESESDGWRAAVERVAMEYGRQRKKQGYTIPLITLDFQLAKEAVYDVLQIRMIAAEMAGLTADLKKLEHHLGFAMRKSLEPFARAKRASASTH